MQRPVHDGEPSGGAPHPRLRRTLAALRLHRRVIVLVALCLGILLMVFHWS